MQNAWKTFAFFLFFLQKKLIIKCGDRHASIVKIYGALCRSRCMIQRQIKMKFMFHFNGHNFLIDIWNVAVSIRLDVLRIFLN